MDYTNDSSAKIRPGDVVPTDTGNFGKYPSEKRSPIIVQHYGRDAGKDLKAGA
jgi:hypothetical protein